MGEGSLVSVMALKIGNREARALHLGTVAEVREAGQPGGLWSVGDSQEP